MQVGGRAAIAAVILLIAGCGGSDGSTSGSVTIPPVTPTPSPTPAPSPAYATFTDLDASWTTTGPFVYAEVLTQDIAPYAVLKAHADFPAGHILQATYTGSPGNESAYLADFIRNRPANFTVKDLKVKSDIGVAFSIYDEDRHSELFSIGNPLVYDYKYIYLAPVLISFEYPYGAIDPFGDKGTNERKYVSYNGFFGVKTEHSDFPNEGMTYSSYGIITGGAGKGSFVGLSQAQLQMIPGNHKIFGEFIHSVSDTTLGNLTSRVKLSGTIDAASHFLSGDMASADGDWKGKFQGYLYGPKGKELGLIFYLRGIDGKSVFSGIILGNAGIFHPNTE